MKYSVVVVLAFFFFLRNLKDLCLQWHGTQRNSVTLLGLILTPWLAELQSPDNLIFTWLYPLQTHRIVPAPSPAQARKVQGRGSSALPSLPPAPSPSSLPAPFPFHPTGPVISCLSQRQPKAIFMLLHIIVTLFYNLFVFISSICLSWDWPLVQHWQTCVWDEQTSSSGRQTEINGTQTALQYIIRAQGGGKKNVKTRNWVYTERALVCLIKNHTWVLESAQPNMTKLLF